ncbi:hypothetical protein NLX86_13870 [Streptomyces sp. A3M-1-3]|uniref:hypothetical protein n=1 Tax=Streptomyces sp. A3M-1-3 TaxID=2962044 RepID=UPI0020B6E171|nr:hypothetical protein [Streptomyces sp. A3M-1-3]MCP3819154.1 hypothetical protein [Streptomyces sp. A3M-1-3]
MRSLPVTLAVRLLPVAVLATVGWAWTSGPYAPATGKDAPRAAASPGPQAAAAAGAATEVAVAPVYGKPPAACAVITAATVKALVPGGKTAGTELPPADPSHRRTCSWSGLDEYEYHWLDVTLEVRDSVDAARTAYAKRQGRTAVPGLGDEASVARALTTEDKQQTREAVVVVRVENAMVTVAYNGSDFESKGAPAEAVIREGAVRAAKDAVAALEKAAGED